MTKNNLTKATLMIDVAGTTLEDDDVLILDNHEIAGVILFSRNVESPTQVRALTDAMRAINPNLIIAADQEGGRVARFRTGFTPLPAMGRLGQMYDDDPNTAVHLAYNVGYLMACEVLAVGVDISFAPVLDIDGGSLVIGDRAFHRDPLVVNALARAFIKGMNDVGMQATGKHFPGHGSVIPDSHVSDVNDGRTFDEIFEMDLKPFCENLDHLQALMPAHVVFERVDDKPAGFSKVWLQDILRAKLGYQGVLFSDDLSMKAAHQAGTVGERVKSALQAGCDVALVCNDRQGAWQALATTKELAPRQDRFSRMKSHIPAWQGDLESTCRTFEYYARAKELVSHAFFGDTVNASDPTNYQI